jgi:hypothetical protein
VSIDLGRQLDIVSQPDRVTFADLVAGVGVEDVRGKIEKLHEYADKLDVLAKQYDDASFPSESRRWANELGDGFEIDQLRTRFVIASYEAVLAHLDGDVATAGARSVTAAKLMDDAREVVARRHGDMHDTHGRRLLEKSSDVNGNRTIYQYGYLYMADILCFWQRELTQVDAILGRTSAIPPGCLLP